MKELCLSSAVELCVVCPLNKLTVTSHKTRSALRLRSAASSPSLSPLLLRGPSTEPPSLLRGPSTEPMSLLRSPSTEPMSLLGPLPFPSDPATRSLSQTPRSLPISSHSHRRHPWPARLCLCPPLLVAFSSNHQPPPRMKTLYGLTTVSFSRVLGVFWTQPSSSCSFISCM